MSAGQTLSRDADDLVFLLVAENLAEMMGRDSPRITGVSTAKEIHSFAATTAGLGRLLARFGIGAQARNRLLSRTLPSLLASLVKVEADPTPPPGTWREDMVRALARYVSAGEPFSLNVMNIGLNLTQYALFRECDFKGQVLDLGSGNGYVSDIILGSVRERTVLSDLLPSEVVKGRRYGFRQAVGIDMHELPYADESFDTIVSIHSVDNAGQREVTLREALRVLRPGGRLIFTDFLSNFVVSRPLPQMLDSIGLRNLAKAYDSYALRYSIDSVDRTALTLADYKTMLKTIGFELELSRTFFGDLLFQYCYLTFDLELLLRDQSIWRYRLLHGRSIADLYRQIAADTLLPLIFADLNDQNSSQTQVFFQLRKPGRANPATASPPLPVCPVCKGLLVSAGSVQKCSVCSKSYPIIDDVPLLISSAMDAFELARRSRRRPGGIVRLLARRLRSRVLN